jgi:hypothetical protein
MNLHEGNKIKMYGTTKEELDLLDERSEEKSW